MVPSGRSGRSTLVTSTVPGPMARARSTESRVESRSPGSVSVRKPSSNWLGVIRSACGHDPLAQQHRDGGVHEAAGCRVAHDRVAGVDRGGVGGLGAGHGVEDDLADLLAALVAGQHGVDLGEGAALLDAGDHLAHVVRGHQRAAPRAVAGVVGEVHGVHRPHLDAEPLEREDGGGVADVAVGHRGLDGQDRRHRPILAPACRRPKVGTRGAQRRGAGAPQKSLPPPIGCNPPASNFESCAPAGEHDGPVRAVGEQPAPSAHRGRATFKVARWWGASNKAGNTSLGPVCGLRVGLPEP